MGGVGWRNGIFAAHATLCQGKATDNPNIALKICRLDKDVVFG